jgi:UDP-N-acetylmuramate dehydrogenase
LIQYNISLRPYNTFGIDVLAERFMEVRSVDDLLHLPQQLGPLRVLGGGSNLLLRGNLPGLVLHNQLQGWQLVRQDDEHVWLKVQSGTNWHQFVMHTVACGWGGVENLALIPGTVGAAPIQNIGAYGVEAEATIEEVGFWHFGAAKSYTYRHADCHFGYRDSVFKTPIGREVFITQVLFRLAKHPKLNVSYGSIPQELTTMGVSEPSVARVAEAVIRIRSSKLPDPAKIGNSGSFFKNPVIAKTRYAELSLQYPQLPCFVVSESLVKVPAAWLIEQAGWKGYRRGDAGVHQHQALVLCNYGGASGSELWQLSSDIQASVSAKFGVSLEREVQVWP